ncbi:MAG: hypothetical protein MET45_09230 [Nostoc sp. LLA-1]|nr:hypothetical protein [Cyanocohniella sp. LLY]
MSQKKNSGDDFGFKNLDKFKFKNPTPRRQKFIPEPSAPLPNIDPPSIDP